MSRDIDVGVFLVTISDLASPENFASLATVAESVGVDVISVGDHVAIPAEVPQTYPFSETGESPMQQDTIVYDTFQSLAYVAAETEELTLATNVAVAPYRHPVTLVKHVLTLDNLTGGRTAFGVGAGWMETEFELLDVPFAERGAWTDDFLEILDRAGDEAAFAFDGRVHSFQQAGFHPRPVQNGGPPILVGGNSGPAFRRAAEYGDGWTIFTGDPDVVSTGADRLRTAWRDFDRDGDPEIEATITELPVAVEDGTVTGDVAAVEEQVGRLSAAGVTRITVLSQAMAFTPDNQRVLLEWVVDDLVPRAT